MVYLLDTNIFVESRKNLPMDVWITFWSKLSELAMNGQIVSSIKVKDELSEGYDELLDWLTSHVPDGFSCQLTGLHFKPIRLCRTGR